MYKKIIAMLLSFVLFLSCVPATVFAKDTTTASLKVEQVYATPGSTVSVDIDIEGNPGILGATLNISWAEGLTLVDSKNGLAFSELTFQAPSRYTSGCNFVWYGSSVNEVVDGTILTLTFAIEDTAQDAQVYDINVNYDSRDILNQEYNPVELEVTNGRVQIVTYKPGDVTGDDRINPLDLIKLCQFISDGCKTDPNGFNVEINENAADVNDDGRLNPLDLILISRFISDGCVTNPDGYNVELKPSTPKCTHALEETKEKVPTCTEEGNIAYWYCSECKKYFRNASGTTEVELSDTILEPTGHHIVLIPGYEPTKTKEGLTDGKACDSPGCDYVEVEQEVIPVLTGYAINYEIANGEDYIESQNLIIPADKRQYFSDEGIELPQLKVAGYRFIGWSYSQASSANIVTEIEPGTTGSKTLYAHWQIIEYTVTFDSPDIPVDNVTYTVDKGTTLKNPSCFGYTFMGWSNDNGFIVSRIKPGTTGHMTLHANWTSDRNKATSYQSYGEPIIIEDDIKKQILFVYNIGKIDNVPLNEVEFIGKTETLQYKKEVMVTDRVDETYVDNINKMVSEATTKSSGWTLSKEWNDIYETAEEVGQLSEKSDERTTSEGKTVGGKYFVSNSEGGSSHVSMESGSSASNSSKITTENSMGINASYDTATEKYCDAKLSAENKTEVSAGVEVPVKVAKVSAGVKNTTTVGAEVTNGRKDTSAFHIDGSISKYVGTEDVNNSSAYYNSSVSNSSSWNSTQGYEKSSEISQTESITNAIKEQISQTTSHKLSKALGEVNSETAEKQEQQMSSEEYSTSFTYGKGTQTTTAKTFEFNSSEAGYYRIITAGTVHVYGVVGYDIATSSYYTYCYNVLDDTTREILDYSKDNMLFNDCENGVVAFEVPYEVNEYVAGFVGKTDGLQISYEGKVTGFTPWKNFNGTVVVPQYDAKDNKDGSFSAVKVTSISDAFAGNEDITTVILPIYVTEIPDGAFAGCKNLKTVIAYGVTKIGTDAFKGCTSLEKFTIDNAVVSLGNNAFDDVPKVAITAYDSKVAEAAINCGAKEIELNVGYVKDNFDNQFVEVDSDVAYFALIGNGGTYKNVQIESNAQRTMISNMIFVDNQDTPMKMSSSTVTLARVTVEESPACALVMTAEQVELALLGKVSLNADVENTVLSKNVILDMADSSTTSSLEVNGKYLVCGAVTNPKYLNVEPTIITPEQFESYLVSSIVSFDANGGTVNQTSKIVYMGQQYGALPIPEKQYFAFKGWFTEKEGGTLITANTDVKTKVNQTVYAQWEAITATLNFNANGGQVSTGSKIVYTGEKVGTLPQPTRTHYSFKGWFTAASGGTQITEDSVLTIAETKTVYAQWNLVPYKVSWNTGTGYSIAVSRTSSPNAGAPTGSLNNNATVYYGDVLSISYTASTGYSISSKGSTSVTVSGNVSSSTIYATATLNSYTYNIVYKSSNGTSLGSSSATYKYGTTNTISAPAKTGYNTPTSQSVKWDSTNAKTITFTYSPVATATSQHLTSGTWWASGGGGITFSVNAEYRNRTANSVEVTIVWTQTIKNAAFGYNQYYYASFNNQSAATGNVKIASTSTWPYYSSSGPWHSGSVVARSAWVKVPLSTTNATTVTVNCDWWTDGENLRGSWGNKTISIPAY